MIPITWDAATIARLRELWAEGVFTAEIARRMSTTKNSVVGKAHRLHLPPRPSPIGARGPKPPAIIRPPVVVARGESTCQWPTSDGRPWRFCDAPASAGRPYCAGHQSRAFKTEA